MSQVSQIFVIPVAVSVLTDSKISPVEFTKHTQLPVDEVLDKDIYDRLDRDAANPMPFTVDKVDALWGVMSEIPGGADDILLVARLNESEVRALKAILLDNLKGFMSEKAQSLIEKIGLDKM